MSSPRRRRKKNADSPLLAKRAIDFARAVLVELDEGGVGPHLGAKVIDEHAATHRFVAEVPGYSGWEWHAVIACAAGSNELTLNEVALVPAQDALKAPEFIPWSQRVQPGDLGPGDVLPAPKDDQRLTPAGQSAEISQTHRQLSVTGLAQAQQRWRDGTHGPDTAIAQQSAAECESCGFFLPLAARVGQDFGVCANEYSADGSVVHAHYGCGAHSDTPEEPGLAHNRGELFADEAAVEWHPKD